MNPITTLPVLEAYLRLLLTYPKLNLTAAEESAAADIERESSTVSSEFIGFHPSNRNQTQKKLTHQLSQATSPAELAAAQDRLARFKTTCDASYNASKVKQQQLAIKMATLLEPALRREREKLVAYIQELRAIDLSNLKLSTSRLLASAESDLSVIEREIETVYKVARGWDDQISRRAGNLGRCFLRASIGANSVTQPAPAASAAPSNTTPIAPSSSASNNEADVVDEDLLAGMPPPPAATEARA